MKKKMEISKENSEYSPKKKISITITKTNLLTVIYIVYRGQHSTIIIHMKISTTDEYCVHHLMKKETAKDY